jgi:hypothetical protein
MYPGEFIQRWKQLNFEALAMQHIEAVKGYIASLNRSQMTKGLGNDGEYMPTYLEDPFFKTRAQAIGYMNYKRKVSPNTQKPAEVRDYYINGYTHIRVQPVVGGNDVTMVANVKWADKMKQARALGLNDDSIKELRHNELYPRLAAQLREMIGLQ